MGQWTYSAYCFFHVETDSYFPGRDFHVSRLHPESNDEYPSTDGATSGVGFTLETNCYR
jgi:hypothetical protein